MKLVQLNLIITVALFAALGCKLDKKKDDSSEAPKQAAPAPVVPANANSVGQLPGAAVPSPTVTQTPVKAATPAISVTPVPTVVANASGDLTITGRKKQCGSSARDLNIAVQRIDGTWFVALWPRANETLRVPGVCRPGVESVVKIEARRSPAAFRPIERRCFVGKSEATNGVNVGFAIGCRADNYHDMEDAIALLKCESATKTKIEDLTLDENISLFEWLRFRNNDC